MMAILGDTPAKFFHHVLMPGIPPRPGSVVKERQVGPAKTEQHHGIKLRPETKTKPGKN